MHRHPGVITRPLVLEASDRRDLPHLHSVLTSHARHARHGARFVLHTNSIYTTGEPALDIHYYSGLMGLGLSARIREVFEPDYAGARWVLHRLLWRHPPPTYFIPSLALFRAPVVVIRNYPRAIWERVRVRLGLKKDIEQTVGERFSQA